MLRAKEILRIKSARVSKKKEFNELERLIELVFISQFLMISCNLLNIKCYYILIFNIYFYSIKKPAFYE